MIPRLVPALLCAAASATAGAQANAIHREPLEMSDFPGNGLHTATVRTTIDAGGAVPPHVHAGLEVAYVASGIVAVTIGTAAPRTIAAGGSFQVPARVRHGVRNAGTGPAVVVSTYVVDPAAPLATPAP